MSNNFEFLLESRKKLESKEKIKMRRDETGIKNGSERKYN